MPIPAVARSKVWVCVSSLAGLRVRFPAGAWMSVSCESVVRVCQVVDSATGRSAVQRNPTACGVSLISKPRQ